MKIPDQSNITKIISVVNHNYPLVSRDNTLLSGLQVDSEIIHGSVLSAHAASNSIALEIDINVGAININTLICLYAKFDVSYVVAHNIQW